MKDINEENKISASPETSRWAYKVQKDLDNGMFYKICSNESTFKEYVAGIVKATEQRVRVECVEILHKHAMETKATEELDLIEKIQREILLTKEN